MSPLVLTLRALTLLVLFITPSLATAMGLRSFVALPIEKGGKVIRLQLQSNRETHTDTFVSNLAWGIDHQQTLLMGAPYRLSPSGDNQLGDVSLLYRYIAWQDDQREGSQRLGLLGGFILPTHNESDAAWQAGAVYSKYAGRHEWDIDALYQAGTGSRADSARYDISYQYRLSPAVYPDWGAPDAEWDGVVELNTRWQENTGTMHQVTLGLQRITQQWVLETGFVKGINKRHEAELLFSIRFHY